MLRDITLGQYYQTDSVIHRLDPRVKLSGTILFILSLFFFKNYIKSELVIYQFQYFSIITVILTVFS